MVMHITPVRLPKGASKGGEGDSPVVCKKRLTVVVVENLSVLLQ